MTHAIAPSIEAPPKVNRLVWPGILIALPLSVVVASAITAIFILRHPEGLVAEDYYKQGKAINANLAKVERARALGADRIDVQRTAHGLEISFPAAKAELGIVEFTFAHPADPSQDKKIAMTPNAEKRYVIALDKPFDERRRVLATDIPLKLWRAETVLAAPSKQ
jgi:uncharacterized protein